MKLDKVVISVKEGEQDILFTVYRKYRNGFIEWATKNYNCSEDTAKGVLKQVLQSFYVNINSGRVVQLAEDLKAYLFHHGKIKLINLLRPKYSNCSVGQGGDDEPDCIDKPILNHGVKFLSFQTEYDDFDERSKKLLRLFYIQNLSAREVAKLMGLKNAEASRLNRQNALASFRQQVLKSPQVAASNFEEINNFLFGNMVAGEKALFQARLLIDTQLALEVQELERAVETFTSLDENALLGGFAAIDRDLDASPGATPARKKLLPISVAASIVLTVCLLYFMRSAKDRVSEFEEVEIGLPVVMGESDVLFDNAMSYYKMGEYQKSLAVLDQISVGKGTDTLSYYRGVNHYMLSDYRSAINSFQSVDKTSAFYFQAKYRMGLAFWHAEQLQDAKRVFTTLAGSRSPYKERAQKILLELD